MREIIVNMMADGVGAALTIAMWELFGRDFITWDGFGTPFRRKNRKEQP